MALGFPVLLATVLPDTWADPTVRYDARLLPDIEVQVDGSPASYTVSRSLDGTTYYTDTAAGSSGVISAAGIYRLTGSAYIKLTGGSGATKFTIRAGS